MLPFLRGDEAQYMVPTIYATEPWSPSAQAMVAWGSLMGGLPAVAADLRMTRVIEVEAATALLKDRYFDLSASGRYDDLSRLLLERVALSNQRRDPYLYRPNDI
jgi:hypothetical protein